MPYSSDFKCEFELPYKCELSVYVLYTWIDGVRLRMKWAGSVNFGVELKSSVSDGLVSKFR